MIQVAKFMPPPPQASDFLVTVWLRKGGMCVPMRLATDACDEQSARENVLRSIGATHDPERAKSIADIRIRRRG